MTEVVLYDVSWVARKYGFSVKRFKRDFRKHLKAKCKKVFTEKDLFYLREYLFHVRIKQIDAMQYVSDEEEKEIMAILEGRDE